jgi:SAM-dependent methyltransferase
MEPDPLDGYGELCTRFYDLDKPTAPELALEWFARELAGCSSVLEPMCGSGRFLVPLIERGLRVDGVDPSQPMLDACRVKLKARGLSAGLWQQSLETLDLEQTYAAAFIPASSFCLLHEIETAREALRRLRAHADLVVIEFELPQGAADWPKETKRTVTDGGLQIRLVSSIAYDVAKQVETHTNRYELKRSGRVVQTEQESLRLRCYAPDEMRAQLARAGFSDITIEHLEFGWVAKAR